MQQITVRGLVLRETAYQETDKLFDLLTEDGILTVRARGARKPGSKYGALTQAFVYGDYCLRQSGDRYFLDSAVSRNLFYGLRKDLASLALAAYFSELIRKTATNQPQPQLLRLFVYALHFLSEHSRPLLLIKPIFELRLMTELGMMPNLVCCIHCLQYLPARPVLRVQQADLFCSDCLSERVQDDMEVTPAVLQAARHVVFSEYDRLFQFRLSGQSLDLFVRYAERYLLYRLGRSFSTLHYFQTLTAQLPPVPDEPGNENTYGQ